MATGVSFREARALIEQLTTCPKCGGSTEGGAINRGSYKQPKFEAVRECTCAAQTSQAPASGDAAEAR
jgi:hypothetical protein